MTEDTDRLTAEDWQAYLDTKFPDGVQINVVTEDGGLDADAYNIPYLVVLMMQGELPVLRGFHLDTEMDLTFGVTDWEEIDRSGHFVARATTAEGRVLELSSWLAEPQAEAMRAIRPEHEQGLQEVAEMMRADVERTAAPQPDVE